MQGLSMLPRRGRVPVQRPSFNERLPSGSDPVQTVGRRIHPALAARRFPSAAGAGLSAAARSWTSARSGTFDEFRAGVGGSERADCKRITDFGRMLNHAAGRREPCRAKWGA